jgi:hypothetical protein
MPASYKSRDIDVALGYDRSEQEHVEFHFLRLDQTDVEFPGQIFDLDFLVTDAYELQYVLEGQNNFDELEVEVWYNRTRFEGHAQRSGKRRQIPQLQCGPSQAALCDFLGTFVDPQGVLNFVGSDCKGVPLVRDDAARLPVFAKPERPGNRRMAALAGVYSVDRFTRTTRRFGAALRVRSGRLVRRRPGPCRNCGNCRTTPSQTSARRRWKHCKRSPALAARLRRKTELSGLRFSQSCRRNHDRCAIPIRGVSRLIYRRSPCWRVAVLAALPPRCEKRLAIARHDATNGHWRQSLPTPTNRRGEPRVHVGIWWSTCTRLYLREGPTWTGHSRAG